MNLRLSLCVLVLSLLAASADAQQIRILSAYYGRPEPEKSVDVKDRVEALVASGQSSFTVNRASMGAPRLNPGKSNFLRVEYLINGRKATGSASDGELFNLRGAGGTVASSGSNEAPLRVINQLGYPIRIYSVDRWGRWSWGEQLRPGGVFSTNSNVGQRWVVTSARDSVVIYDFSARRGDNKVSVDDRVIKKTIVR